MILSFEQYKQQRDFLDSWCSDIGKELSAYPKNEMGMTIESVRVTPEYQSKRALYKKVFAQLRMLNGFYVKHYRKELRVEREMKRAGK